MVRKFQKIWMAMGAAVVASSPLASAGNMTDQELLRFTFTEYHMGIDARLTVYARDEEIAKKACRAAFERIAALEAIMSDYRPDSELMRLCRDAVDKPVNVSPDLFLVLTRGQKLSEETNGAFDVTVGPLVQIWRQARRDKKLPLRSVVLAARELVGWQKVKLNVKNQTVELAAAGMKLDLGGIAKGYAGDEALKAMRENGVGSAMIEMGGDVVMGDPPPKTKGWKISVPNAGGPGKPAEMFLANCAISSSGDTEQFVEIDGVRYSHVVDPATGYGLYHRVQSSVITRRGLDSDPISTALTVLDDAHRAEFVRRNPKLKAFIRVATN